MFVCLFVWLALELALATLDTEHSTLDTRRARRFKLSANEIDIEQAEPEAEERADDERNKFAARSLARSSSTSFR